MGNSFSSRPFNLNSDEIWSVAKGAAIAALGAILTYGTTYVSGADFGQWTPVVVAVWSAAVNLVRKFVFVQD